MFRFEIRGLRASLAESKGGFKTEPAAREAAEKRAKEICRSMETAWPGMGEKELLLIEVVEEKAVPSTW